jgi:hypothetical protein
MRDLASIGAEEANMAAARGYAQKAMSMSIGTYLIATSRVGHELALMSVQPISASLHTCAPKLSWARDGHFGGVA